jgi:ketosteroid isomerase-like protein
MLHAAAMSVLVLVTSPVTADPAPSVEAEIKQLELTLAGYLSRGEIDAYAPSLAEDYVRISADGSVASKAEVLAEFRRSTSPGPPLEPSRLVVRAYGDTAILTGELKIGARRARFTKVFIRRGGRWYLVNLQGTPLKDA